MTIKQFGLRKNQGQQKNLSLLIIQNYNKK